MCWGNAWQEGSADPHQHQQAVCGIWACATPKQPQPCQLLACRKDTRPVPSLSSSAKRRAAMLLIGSPPRPLAECCTLSVAPCRQQPVGAQNV